MSRERRYRAPYLKPHHNSGFSLLEMMSVISLILILASFSMPIYHTIVVRGEVKGGQEPFSYIGKSGKIPA